MLPLRSLFSALALALLAGATGAAHAETWAHGGTSGATTNHDLVSGQQQASYQFPVDYKKDAVQVAGARIGGGNTGEAGGSYRASAGVLKATATGRSIAFTDAAGYGHVGGGGMTTAVAFMDTVTADVDGYYMFSWLVSGSASTTGDGGIFLGEGRFSVQRAAGFQTLGIIDFHVNIDGSPNQNRTSFLAYLTQGEALIVYARMEVTAGAGGGNGPGSSVIDYGNSAYAVIEAYGSGAFHSESGYAYTAPLPVPEPTTWALMFAGLGVLGGSCFRRQSRASSS